MQVFGNTAQVLWVTCLLIETITEYRLSKNAAESETDCDLSESGRSRGLQPYNSVGMIHPLGIMNVCTGTQTAAGHFGLVPK